MTWHPRQRFVLAAAAAIAFLPAACSDESGESTSTRAAEIAACPLITDAEFQKALGTAMGDGKEREPVGGGDNEGRMTGCVWDSSPDAPGGTIATLLVWSWPSGSGGPTNYLESFRQAAKESKDLQTPEPVSLGDEALWDGNTLHARTGDISFSVTVSAKGLDDTQRKTDSQALAENVLSKL